VLMDVHMPVLDGYEATARIRSWEQETGTDPVPIIALTAGAFAEDRARCLEVGMDHYLSKPINLRVLADALAAYLPAVDPTTETAPAELGPTDLALDWSAFTSQAEALLPLLAEARFDAIDRFEELQTLADGTALATSLAPLRPALDAFRFEQVHAALVDLLATSDPTQDR
jgi:DNA-binding response OmpR family regulator